MMLYAAQMITQVMLRCSPHLEAGIFEHAELQPSLDRQEEQRGRTLCGESCMSFCCCCPC